jgi:predicted sulfurtransferase
MEILDCRNYYESEVGLFDGAHRLPIAKHLDSFEEIDKHLEQFEKDKKILIVSDNPSIPFSELRV